jgi:branched-chain amino acid transport system ATP-binding protein
MPPLLEVQGLHAGYGQIEVLHDVTLHVDDGECVATLGRNGAGKTTLMRAVSGTQRASRAHIRFRGRPIERRSASSVAHLGIAYVPEGRRIFRRLSVVDNLKLGAWAVGLSGKAMERQLEVVYSVFPVLERKGTHSAGALSGGEQQMVAIAQALMARPTLLLLDEPSAGLAPPLVAEMFQILHGLVQDGMSILLAEQFVGKALEISSRAYVLDRGTVALEGDAESFASRGRLSEIYMGKEDSTR